MNRNAIETILENLSLVFNLNHTYSLEKYSPVVLYRAFLKEGSIPENNAVGLTPIPSPETVVLILNPAEMSVYSEVPEDIAKIISQALIRMQASTTKPLVFTMRLPGRSTYTRESISSTPLCYGIEFRIMGYVDNENI